MNIKKSTIFKALGLLFLTIATCGASWLSGSEDSCWKQEAAHVFLKYGSIETRTDILQVAGIEKDPGSNPLEYIEKDPNGCSLGSNGQTVVRFFFNDNKKLTRIQVFKNYIASDYKMQLIEERWYIK